MRCGEETVSSWLDIARDQYYEYIAIKFIPPGERYARTQDNCQQHALTLSFGMVGIGTIHSIGLPVHVYPLYENGFRAYHGQSINQNDAESAHMYNKFAKIAEHNQFARNYRQPAPSVETISTVTKRNRMICFPCDFPRW